MAGCIDSRQIVIIKRKMANHSQLTTEEIQQIASEYGLTVTDFEPFDGGVNSSFLLHIEQGDDLTLTVFETMSFDAVTRQARLLDMLAAHKFPTARLLHPANGGYTVTHAGKPVMLKTFIRGQVCSGPDEIMLQQMGMAIARLHQIPVPDYLPDWFSYGLDKLPRILNQNIDREFESALGQRIAVLEAAIPSGLPKGLVHGDLFFDNVLFMEREFRAVIDFEDATRHYFIYDLGMAVTGMCAGGILRLSETSLALLTGYQQVRKLEKSELETLPLFIEYGALATACWRFWQYHINVPDVERAEMHLQMVKLAEEVRVMSNGEI